MLSLCVLLVSSQFSVYIIVTNTPLRNINIYKKFIEIAVEFSREKLSCSIAHSPTGGEKGLGIRPLLEYPFYDAKTHNQKFPFRTAIMIIALFTQLLTSFLTRNLLGKGYFPQCCDVLNIYSPGKSKNPTGVMQSSSGAALMDSSSVKSKTRQVFVCSHTIPLDVVYT